LIGDETCAEHTTPIDRFDIAANSWEILEIPTAEPLMPRMAPFTFQITPDKILICCGYLKGEGRKLEKGKVDSYVWNANDY